MQARLLELLHDYVKANNPDLLVQLQQKGMVTAWLEEKYQSVEMVVATMQGEGQPAYMIEKACMEDLTRELRPSRFDYVSEIFSGEFEAAYYALQESGVVTYEVLNILEACTPVFEKMPLTEEDEDNRLRRYAVIGTIKDYLDKKI